MDSLSVHSHISSSWA